MKRVHAFWLVATILALCCAQGVRARTDSTDQEGDSPAAVENRAARVRLLAADVREIADSSLTSRAKKERRISTAVRVAVVAATAYRHDPREVLGLALELTAAAARAAPAYADVIAKAVAFAPSISRIDGASGQIRTTAFAAAKGRRTGFTTSVAAEEAPEERPARTRRAEAAPVASEPTAEMPAEEDNSPSEPARISSASGSYSAAVTSDYPPEMQAAVASTRSSSSGVSLGGDSRLSVTTALSVRHDDNVFLSSTNKTGDTIISAAPGLEFQFGQQSLTHGSVSYQESFNRYTGKTAPNVSLGNGSGNVGYEDGGITAALDASYQQFYQESLEVLVLGRSGLVRSNQLNLNGSVEALFGAKTSFRLGAGLFDNQYVTPGYVSNRYFSVPASIFYKITPKVDLSAGYTYAVETPNNGGPSGRDGYYNLGARGSFTPKLSGTFSLGYQNRSVTGTPQQRIFAFSGAFDYELTAKTKATLAATRNFGASAIGQSTKNSTYSLGLNSTISPQWQVGANVSYQDNDYGAAVFNPLFPASSVLRRDHYWQSSFLVSYLYTQWLSTSASYNFRTNHSTIPGLEFTDNILSLTVGLRY